MDIRKSRSLSRRDFLKAGAMACAGLALRPFSAWAAPWPDGEFAFTGIVGRVTRRNVPVYTQPDLSSRRLRKLEQDAILYPFEELHSPHGPDANPRWYRLQDGFVHSAYIQRVEAAHLNPPLSQVAGTGQLGEVTVPYSQSQYQDRKGAWMPLYRLYYQSLHWITGLFEGPQGEPWYWLSDDWLRLRYCVPASHVRPLAPHEVAPFSASVPDAEKRIAVSTGDQTLTAYEGSQAVLHVPVSTGRRYMETPVGDFHVERKYPSRHMGDGWITSDPRAYELVGVPWVIFFHKAGIAFHGTFWHDNFGEPMSQGCVNMRSADAQWLFRWCAPRYSTQAGEQPTWKVAGPGTRVVVT
jgi:hypothetical protein